MFEFDLFELARETVTLAVGLTAVLASLGVILCSAPVYCALYLIGNMVCLALLFLLFNAEFIAAVQIIVYAGAVMILFLFIIALLGGKKEIQESSAQRAIAFAFVVTMLGELYLSATVGPTRPLEGGFDPQTVAEAGGSAKAIGLELFSRHLVPFELASGLLLVAAVGIICLAKFSYTPARRRTK
ncbi:NADH-quinone oxidoreductase, subunit J [Candidatus Nitromaritima sp. SCGC AAA799-A02]|nr:NADH-quinone oxidoreductase, subunit J [Candidatus Nitromaritima sp. SCGC AAA799-C22]KMP10888.1 NADH-quinone oxidoreductase, subunit J [Candidatus Nitromaritima sp. SCGC AAA799-A02]